MKDIKDMAHTQPVSEEHQIRLEKVASMRKDGIEPWPAYRPVNATCQEVIDEYKDGQESSRNYEVAGRIITMREHGKTAFATLQDRSGRVQIYIRQDKVGEQAFNFLKHYVDIGDILWCSGQSFKTKTGEVTIKVENFSLQSKCLHPLPEKFHGLADVETKYRQRYLDLISTPESRERFKTRSKIISLMRHYFEDHDFIEVETPMLHPIPGGAAARPFVTHHNALDTELFLRIAPELYLKRLVVGGFERVFEINRNFRNEGISTRHNPEFTMVEFYMAHQNYKFIMDFVEDMIKKIIAECSDTMQLPFGEKVIDFGKPFERLSMKESVMRYGGLSEQDLSAANIDATLKKHNISLDNKNAAWGHKLVALFEELVEAKLIQPTYIIDFPIEVSPLAKRDKDDPTIAARFELFIAGIEISNGFNELNDPLDQAQRFKDQVKDIESGDVEAHRYDADYVLALEHGLPPTVGVGIGIDRLTMLLTNTTSIKDVILFPTLKKKA